MNPKTVDKVTGWALVSILSFLFGALALGTIEYKRGQIDALTGDIKYELVTSSDSTRVWKWIDE